MSEPQPSRAPDIRHGATRVVRAWNGMEREQRIASIAALAMLVTLFLPWYQKSFFEKGGAAQDSISGFGSADFVLASVVLVAVAVLAMMFARGEGRGFHLPGGDGLVIIVAGGWCALLIFYRVLDHPDVAGAGATIGIQWGVFVAFLAAAFLVYAGVRIRVADRPEPPLPAADDPTAATRPARPARRASAARDEAWMAVEPLQEPPTERAPSSPSPPAARGPGAGEEPTEIVPRRRRPRPPQDDDAPLPGQLSFDETETRRRPD